MISPSKSKHVVEEQHAPTMPHDKTDKLMDKKRGIKEGSSRDMAMDSAAGLPD